MTAQTNPKLIDMTMTRIEGARAAIDALERVRSDVAGMAGALRSTLAGGGLVATAGNGGSAAEALHLAEELVGNYRDRTRPPRRGICFNADPTALTCIANDFGFDAIFERQVHALLKPGDLFVGFSTSGNSPNLNAAFGAARAMGVTTAGLLGRDGGAAKDLCDHHVIVDVPDSGHIQEAHQVVLHILW